ncbi:MAG: N-acetylmuramoyl-L-alanine amidase [Verrucomicrobia bacterium]|nr:N-acetylmuramoyl-L-alanine amidase [Verrucomicrobiota bacterium]
MARRLVKRMAALSLAGILVIGPAHAATESQSRQPVALAAADAASARLPTLRMGNCDFVDLAAWAKTKSLRLSWVSTNSIVGLTNRSNRLRGSVGSRQLEINGVKTWLSSPITSRNGLLYITTLDMRTLLDPILVPVRNKPGQRVRVIALDPGHGGRDPGFKVGKEQEKVLTLLWARRLKARLEQAGFEVILTRARDVYIGLDDRVAAAWRARADLFISLHYNAASEGSAAVKGVETYCLTPAGAPSTNVQPEQQGSTAKLPGNTQDTHNILLAYHVQKSMVTRMRVEDRGVRRARFVVLRNTDMPAILVEGGFLSTPDEARRIADPTQRDLLAKAVVEGVLAYKRLVERR